MIIQINQSDKKIPALTNYKNKNSFELIIVHKYIMGYSRKNPHTPDRWQDFLTLPSTRISWATWPPPTRISKSKGPPSHSDFHSSTRMSSTPSVGGVSTPPVGGVWIFFWNNSMWFWNKITDEGGGEFSQNNWVGVYRWAIKTLNLFQTIFNVFLSNPKG